MSTAVAVAPVPSLSGDTLNCISGGALPVYQDIPNLSEFHNGEPKESLVSNHNCVLNATKATPCTELRGLKIRIFQDITSIQNISEKDLKYRFGKSCLHEIGNIPIRKSQFRAKAMKKFRRKITPSIIMSSDTANVARQPTGEMETDEKADGFLSEKGEDVVPDKDTEDGVLVEASDVVMAEKPNEAVLAEDRVEATLTEEAEEAVLADDGEEVVLAEDVEEAVLADDEEEVVLVEDAGGAVLVEDAEEAVLAEDVDEIALAEDSEETVLAEYAEETVLAEDAEEALLAEDGEEAVLTDEAEEVVLGEDAKEAVLVEDAEENVLVEAAEEAVLAEDAEEDVLTEDGEEAVLAEDAEEAVLTEDAEEDVLIEDVEGAVLAEDAEEAVLVEDAEEVVLVDEDETVCPEKDVQDEEAVQSEEAARSALEEVDVHLEEEGGDRFTTSFCRENPSLTEALFGENLPPDGPTEKPNEIINDIEPVSEELIAEMSPEVGPNTTVQDECVAHEVPMYMDTSAIEIVMDSSVNDGPTMTTSENMPCESETKKMDITNLDVPSRSPQKAHIVNEIGQQNESIYENEDPLLDLGDTDEHPVDGFDHNEGSQGAFSHVDDIFEIVDETVIDTIEEELTGNSNNSNDYRVSAQNDSGEAPENKDNNVSVAVNMGAKDTRSPSNDTSAVCNDKTSVCGNDSNNNNVLTTSLDQIPGEGSGNGQRNTGYTAGDSAVVNKYGTTPSENDSNNNTLTVIPQSQVHDKLSIDRVTIKPNDRDNLKPTAGSMSDAYKRKPSRLRMTDTTKQERLDKKQRRVIQVDTQPVSNPDLLGNILAGITGLGEDLGNQPGKSVKGSSPKHPRNASQDKYSRDTVPMDLDDSEEHLEEDGNAIPVLSGHVASYVQDSPEQIPVIGSQLPPSDFSIASYINDAPWNFLSVPPPSLGYMPPPHVSSPGYMPPTHVSSSGYIPPNPVSSPAFRPSNLAPVQTHMTPNSANLILPPPPSVCSSADVPGFNTLPSVLQSLVTSVPPPPPPPPPPPQPEPEIPGLHDVALPPNIEIESHSPHREASDQLDFTSKEKPITNQNGSSERENDQPSGGVLGTPETIESEKTESMNEKVLDILVSIQNKPNQALIQSAIDLLSKSKSGSSPNASHKPAAQSDPRGEKSHKPSDKQKRPQKSDISKADTAKESKSKDTEKTTKPSTAGKFHGRTLLQGRSVPARMIPLEPLYLVKPLTSRGTLQVIPVDPRLELVRSPRTDPPGKNGFTYGKSIKNTDPNYRLIAISKASDMPDENLRTEPEEPLVDPRDIDKLLDELLIRSSRKDAPSVPSKNQESADNRLYQEEQEHIKPQFYNPKHPPKASSVLERKQHHHSLSQHESSREANEASYSKLLVNPFAPPGQRPPVYLGKLDQCDYSNKKHLAMLDNISGTLSSAVVLGEDDSAEDEYLPQPGVGKRTNDTPVSRLDLPFPCGIPDLADTPSPMSVTSSPDLDDEPTKAVPAPPVISSRNSIDKSDREDGELQDTPKSNILTFDFTEDKTQRKRKKHHKKHKKSLRKGSRTQSTGSIQLNTSDVSSDSLCELEWEIPDTKRLCKSPTKTVLSDRNSNRPGTTFKAAGSMLERRYAEEDKYYEDAPSRSSRKDKYLEGSHPANPIVLSRSPSSAPTSRDSSRGSNDRSRNYGKRSRSRSPPKSWHRLHRESRSPVRLHSGRRSRSPSVSSRRDRSSGSRTSSRGSSPVRGSGRCSRSPSRSRRSPGKSVYSVGRGWGVPASNHDEDKRYREIMERLKMCHQGIVPQSESRLPRSGNNSPTDDWAVPSRPRDSRRRQRTSPWDSSSRASDLSSSGRRPVTGTMLDIAQRRFQRRDSQLYDPAFPTITDSSRISSAHSRLGPPLSVSRRSSDRDLRDRLSAKDLRAKIRPWHDDFVMFVYRVCNVCWVTVVSPKTVYVVNNFSEICISISKFSFREMHLKMSHSIWRSFILASLY